MVTKYYNIHNLIKMKVVNHRKVFDRLALFEVHPTDTTVDIILGNFTPPHTKGYKKVGKYLVGDQSLYCKYRHKLSFWKIWIKNIDQEKTTIHFYGEPFFSYELLLMLIVEPLLAYKLSKKGTLVLHASSLSINGRGFLFTGDTGMGKTTILLKLLQNQNTKYFSDDQSLVKGTTLYSYPLPIGFRKHLVDKCGIKLSTYDYFMLVLQELVNIVTMYYPNLSRRVETGDITFGSSGCGVSVGQTAPISSIFILTKSIGPVGIQKISPKQAYRKILVCNTGNEDKLAILHQYFSAYKQRYSSTDYWEDYRRELQKLVYRDINFYQVSMREKYNFDNLLDRVRQIVELGDYDV